VSKYEEKVLFTGELGPVENGHLAKMRNVPSFVTL
jgi:hypothetical protein